MARIFITGSTDGLGRATAHTLLGEVPVRLGISFGLATWSDHGRQLEDLRRGWIDP